MAFVGYLFSKFAVMRNHQCWSYWPVTLSNRIVQIEIAVACKIDQEMARIPAFEILSNVRITLHLAASK